LLLHFDLQNIYQREHIVWVHVRVSCPQRQNLLKDLFKVCVGKLVCSILRGVCKRFTYLNCIFVCSCMCRATLLFRPIKTHCLVLRPEFKAHDNCCQSPLYCGLLPLRYSFRRGCTVLYVSMFLCVEKKNLFTGGFLIVFFLAC
jgi:hypothetical protein